MRHKDVHLCAIGSLALYLWYRFDVCGEMIENPPDFTDNKSWYHIKLLIAYGTTDVTKELELQSYNIAIDKALKELNIPCSHRAHFGRKAGPQILEQNEVPKDVIEALGNWSQTVQEKCYSSWLPMLAMRVMAGFTKDEGSVYVKRQMKPRSEAGDRLANKIFPWQVPFLWFYSAIDLQHTNIKKLAKLFYL